MPDSPPTKMIRARLAVIACSILGLALAGLNSAIARFSIILRDRARSEITDPENGIVAHSFERLMGNVFANAVVAVFPPAISVIYGLALVLCTKWLREKGFYYGAMQLILGLFMVVTGAYLAFNVRGFQSSFARMQGDDRIPYYAIMYYGGVGEAASGALVIFMFLGTVLLALVFGG
ncbi:uncharacterized protein LDX57_006127 [Aspergillus melleus]|uniref:uncharacterized protein n=1 Tax=Aspergillus melleus TaxID=138277 RepID=UPI001E8CF25F|nr:uncharacterized protein LDX57_006127 [Aspergillus melleus]KAH8428429.1 hypothetical protein LDX57_006127 [Aspergillus melleus]